MEVECSVSSSSRARRSFFSQRMRPMKIGVSSNQNPSPYQKFQRSGGAPFLHTSLIFPPGRGDPSLLADRYHQAIRGFSFSERSGIFSSPLPSPRSLRSFQNSSRMRWRSSGQCPSFASFDKASSVFLSCAGRRLHGSLKKWFSFPRGREVRVFFLGFLSNLSLLRCHRLLLKPNLEFSEICRRLFPPLL